MRLGYSIHHVGLVQQSYHGCFHLIDCDMRCLLGIMAVNAFGSQADLLKLVPPSDL